MRKAKVYMNKELAGYLTENEDGYAFKYDDSYLTISVNKPVSVTLPLQEESYRSRTLFPFFDGLIPEGWLLEIATKNWKLNVRDRMGLLLLCCRNCIGSVSIEEDNS
jgi:serine/threonine-protein kinase HipA